MINAEEIELYNKTLAGKQFKAVELTNEGYVIIFDDNYVIKIDGSGQDIFYSTLMIREPSYRYKEVWK
ncbi:hypothetical protein [Paenibacillus pini]|uniref:Uncharacterized protein n=1 Tax=Paenibacillus pini JCM 16418 TaxID=1236976 RepID=W7YIJ5_9BACL|nr:hypothetical protein [Paenibacillus pini]GAF10720.1 hypothetical protein JCM16418_4939 [Paenibacillus pini JCM 16418]